MNVPGQAALSRAARRSRQSKSFALLGAVMLLAWQAPSYGDQAAAKKEITRIEPQIALHDFKPLDALAAPGKAVPAAASHETYQGADGLRVGVWEGEPGTLQLTDYPFDEFCLIVTGELVVTSAGGKPLVFQAGDSFVIPKGFTGTWEMKTRVRKQSVLVATSPPAR